MNTTEFTPGPWEVSTTSKLDEVYCYFLNVGPASVLCDRQDGVSTLDHANANLISAAPDLYTWLKWFVDYHVFLEPETENDQDVVVARTALAKARGET